MTAVALVAAKIAPVFTDPGHCEIYNGELGEAVTAGQVLMIHTDGTWKLADADASLLDEPQGLALEKGAIGQTISILRRGPVYGFTVAGLNAGTLVSLSTTPGGVDTTGDEKIGRIVSLSEGATANFVIHFDFFVSKDFN